MGKQDIEAFIAGLTHDWQRQVCADVLRYTLAADPSIDMSIKWGNPFFSHNGAVLKWFVAKDWINVYFYKGSQLDDPASLFIETDNKTMRTIKYFKGDKVTDDALTELIAKAVHLNKKSS